jgi:hypothetical protein
VRFPIDTTALSSGNQREKTMIFRRVLAAGALTTALLSITATAAAATLATPFNLGGGVNGLMFDIVVGANSLRLETIEVNVSNVWWDYEFYTKAGGIFEKSSSWTLHDHFSGQLPAGIDKLTSFDMTDINLAAGSTLGLYFVNTIPGFRFVQYSAGPPLGTVIADDGALAIKAGFATIFYPEGEWRNAPYSFKGALTYTLTSGVPEPSLWTMMIGGFGMIGTAFRRREAQRISG